MLGAFPRRWQAAPLLAAAAGLLTLAIGLSRVPLDTLSGQTPAGGPAADWLVTAAAMIPAAAVGAFLAARRPRNPIGWIVLAIFALLAAPYNQYLLYAYRLRPGSAPLGGVAVAGAGAWPVLLALITIMLWVFPDGRLPSGRRRRLVLVMLVVTVLLGLAVSAGLDLAVARNPILVDADGNLLSPLPRVAGLLIKVLLLAVLASWLVWLVVQVRAYRRAAGERRQQLKWLSSGAAVTVVTILLPDSGASGLVGPFGVAALPVCMAVAVLKYRLYAIDRIVSRVMAYLVITVILAGVFAGLVLLATEVLPAKTPVAVAAATLAAAALFNPLRRRVQHAVDCRFNRARYNAEEVVTAFAGRLRATADPSHVTADLVRAVDAAFEPTHVTLWLPGPDRNLPLLTRPAPQRRPHASAAPTQQSLQPQNPLAPPPQT